MLNRRVSTSKEKRHKPSKEGRAKKSLGAAYAACGLCLFGHFSVFREGKTNGARREVSVARSVVVGFCAPTWGRATAEKRMPAVCDIILVLTRFVGPRSVLCSCHLVV